MSKKAFIFLLILLFHLTLLGVLLKLHFLFLVIPLSVVLLVIVRYEEAYRKRFLLITLMVFLIAVGRTVLAESIYDGTMDREGQMRGEITIRSCEEYLNPETEEVSYRTVGEIENFKVIFYHDSFLDIGNVYRVKGELKLPKASLNTGSFSQRNYLKYQGIYFQLGKYTLEKVREEKTFHYFIALYKNYFLEGVSPYLEEDTGLFKSIFLGSSNELKEEDEKMWRELGIIHLLAVSGSHVDIFLSLGELFILLIPIRGAIKQILLFVMIFLYGIMVLSPSALRCIFFFILIQICRRWDIPQDNVLLLGITSVTVLLLSPYYLFTLSYQLSFMIVLGFYLLKSKKEGGQVGNIIRTGGIAILMSFPLLIYYFQESSFIAILTTPLVAPLVSMVLMLGGLFFYFLPLHGLLYPFGKGLAFLLKILREWVALLGSISFPVLNVRRPLIIHILLYYIFLILLLKEWGNKGKRRMKVLILGFLLTTGSFFISFPSEDLKVHFINVEQGDAVLIEVPKVKRYILIDGGKKDEYSDMGKKEVVPYLKRLGVFSLDLVISTHSDIDHMGGLSYLLSELEVKKLLIPEGMEEGYEVFKERHKELIQEVKKGTKLEIGELAVMFLNPDGKGMGDANRNSVVCELDYKGKSILLTGDCDLDVLEENVGKTFQVVKAPHHGSKKSFRPGIYEELKTEIVIFSSGKNNRYGHPADEIIQDLEETGIDYYRTDEGKEIVVEVGKEIVVK